MRLAEKPCRRHQPLAALNLRTDQPRAGKGPSNLGPQQPPCSPGALPSLGWINQNIVT